MIKYLIATIVVCTGCLPVQAQHQYAHEKWVKENHIREEKVYQFYIVNNRPRDSFLLSVNIYDSAFRPQHASLYNKKEELSNNIGWQYNGNGKKIAVSDTAMADTSVVMLVYIYDSTGNLAFERKYDKEGLNRERSYEYNSSGQLIKEFERSPGSKKRNLKKSYEYRVNGDKDRDVIYYDGAPVDVEYRLLYVYDPQARLSEILYESYRMHEPLYQLEYNDRKQVIAEKVLVRRGMDDGLFWMTFREGDLTFTYKYYAEGLIFERRVQFKDELLHLERHFYAQHSE